MAFLLDTNIAIHARDGDERVLDRLAAHGGQIVISALSYAALQRGLFKDPAAGPLRAARLEVLMEHIPILPFDAAAALAYGRIIAQRGWAKGKDFDRMIAGHAIATRSILVTDNTADFADIPLLERVNWIRP